MSVKFCPLCHAANLIPLSFEVPPEAGEWRQCQECASHVALHEYPEGFYSQKYEADEVANTGGPAERRQQVQSNCSWFPHHHHPNLPRTFLDVGCCDGAALTEMQDVHGFAVHGFDVFEPSYMGPHVTVAPYFQRWLFPRKYSAILCREVIEHVPRPMHLLTELHGVCESNGLIQIQTPRPTQEYNPIGYQRQHLFLAWPAQLKRMIESSGMKILDERMWDIGQAYLCRAI